MTYEYVPNVIEGNGKTIRENNLEKRHAIPIGSLVEIDLEYNAHHGVRLYVSGHSRDCDGSPLYELYYSSDTSSLDNACKLNPALRRFMTINGFSDDCLTVINARE